MSVTIEELLTIAKEKGACGIIDERSPQCGYRRETKEKNSVILSLVVGLCKTRF